MPGCANSRQVPVWFGIVNTVLVFIFVTETILKLLAVGCNEFWKGEECLWNGFDFVIAPRFGKES